MKTSHCFAMLKKLTEQATAYLCFSSSEAAVFDYLSKASAGWQQYAAAVTVKDMMVNNPQRQQPKLPFCRSSLFNAIKSLTDRGILLASSDGYVLNYIMIIRTIYLAYGSDLSSTPDYRRSLEELYYKVSADLLAMGVIKEVEKLPTSEEIMEQLEKTKQAKKESKLAVVPERPLKPTALHDRFVSIFSKAGIACQPFLSTYDKASYYGEINALKKILERFDTNAELLAFLTKCAENWNDICAANPDRFIFGHASIVLINRHWSIIENHFLQQDHRLVFIEGGRDA